MLSHNILWFLDEEINDLNDRLAGLQQIKDHEKDRYEAELQKLRTDYQEMKDQLTSENMILGGNIVLEDTAF